MDKTDSDIFWSSVNLLRQKEVMTLRFSKMSFKTNLNLKIAKKSENETENRNKREKK